MPWHASKVEAPYVFFERGPDAPPPPVSFEEKTSFRARPIRALDAQDAYLGALERDTLEGYLDFLSVYPDDPMDGAWVGACRPLATSQVRACGSVRSTRARRCRMRRATKITSARAGLLGFLCDPISPVVEQ